MRWVKELKIWHYQIPFFSFLVWFYISRYTKQYSYMQMRMLGEKTNYIFFYKKSCRGVLAFHLEIFFNSCLMPFFPFCIFWSIVNNGVITFLKSNLNFCNQKIGQDIKQRPVPSYHATSKKFCPSLLNGSQCFSSLISF